MQKANGEQQKSLRRAAIAFALVAAAVVTGTLPLARAEEDDNWRAYGLASGRAGSIAGQIAIIGLPNDGA